MKILTLDQATRSGWCIGDDALRDPRSPGLLFGSFRMPKRDDPGERLAIFRDGLVELIETHHPDIAAYEEPYMPIGQHNAAKPGPDGKPRMPFNPKTISFLKWIEGVLIETTARYSIPTEHFPSSSWRVTALGTGRLPSGADTDFKKMMKAKARQLGYDVADDNEADAIGMMLHMLYGKPAAERAQGDLLAMESAKL